MSNQERLKDFEVYPACDLSLAQYCYDDAGNLSRIIEIDPQGITVLADYLADSSGANPLSEPITVIATTTKRLDLEDGRCVIGMMKVPPDDDTDLYHPSDSEHPANTWFSVEVALNNPWHVEGADEYMMDINTDNLAQFDKEVVKQINDICTAYTKPQNDLADTDRVNETLAHELQHILNTLTPRIMSMKREYHDRERKLLNRTNLFSVLGSFASCGLFWRSSDTLSYAASTLGMVSGLATPPVVKAFLKRKNNKNKFKKYLEDPDEKLARRAELRYATMESPVAPITLDIQ